MKTLFLLISVSLFLLLNACQTNQKENASTADSTSVPDLPGGPVKLVKTAGINCKVKDVRQSVRTISQLAESLGGVISHQNIESVTGQTTELAMSDDSILVISSLNTYASIKARVPVQSLTSFLYSIEDLSDFTSQSKLDIDDKTLEYLAHHLKQENRKDFLSNSENKKLKGVTGLQLIRTGDEMAEQEIARRQIDTDVAYSTVELHLSQSPFIRKEVIVNYDIASYHLSFSRSLANALDNGWQYFLNFTIAVAHLWMFILLVVAMWLFLKYRRFAIR